MFQVAFIILRMYPENPEFGNVMNYAANRLHLIIHRSVSYVLYTTL